MGRRRNGLLPGRNGPVTKCRGVRSPGVISERELADKWLTQVFRPAKAEVRGLLRSFPDRRQLSIPYEECGTDYRFTAPLVNQPDRTLAAGRRALSEFVDAEFDAEVDGSVDPDDRIYLRVTDVPESARVALSEIRADHLNRLVAVEGRVAAAEEIRPRIVTAAFRCDRCGERVDAPQRGARLRRRSNCPSCSGVETLSLSPDRSEYVDSQRLRLAASDRRLPLSLEHDLVDRFDPGDEIGAVAIPRAVPGGDAATVDVELEALSAGVR